MLVNIVFLLIISSGSLFCAARFDKKYEEILPITCIGYSLVLFLFGIFGNLTYGFYAVLVLSALMYAGCFILVVKHKDKGKEYMKQIICNIVTPGLCFFLIFFTGSSLVLRGLLAHSWDEFSHWIDIVKVMTELDDFGTNPLSYSMFKTYPPIMSLFQYLMQKVFLLIHPEAGFMEWRCYFAWQILFVAVLLPLFSNIKWEQVMKALSLAGIILLVPPIFYNEVYSKAYIDPFLAVLAGSGFSAVVVWGMERKKNILYSVYIWFITAALVLVKDAGMLFAVILAVLYILDRLICKGGGISNSKKGIIQEFLYVFITMLFVAVPKLLWNYEIKCSGLENVSAKIRINYMVLLNVILGKDNSYRLDVMKNYIQALFEPYVSFGHTGISLNYMSLMVIEILFIFHYNVL